jgi:hypothetical protein
VSNAHGFKKVKAQRAKLKFHFDLLALTAAFFGMGQVCAGRGAASTFFENANSNGGMTRGFSK